MVECFIKYIRNFLLLAHNGSGLGEGGEYEAQN